MQRPRDDGGCLTSFGGPPPRGTRRVLPPLVFRGRACAHTLTTLNFGIRSKDFAQKTAKMLRGAPALQSPAEAPRCGQRTPLRSLSLPLSRDICCFRCWIPPPVTSPAGPNRFGSIPTPHMAEPPRRLGSANQHHIAARLRAGEMAIVAFWLALIFFVGCLAMVWWLLLVDHGDLTEEPYEGEQDNPLAGADGVRACVNGAVGLSATRKAGGGLCVPVCVVLCFVVGSFSMCSCETPGS